MPGENQTFKNLSDQDLLTLCLYGEARNQGLDGMLGVASVVITRVKKGGWFGKDIKTVILLPLQFSCFNENNPNYGLLRNIAERGIQKIESPAITGVLKECYWIARGVQEGILASNVKKATHYHSVAVKPAWRRDMTFIRRIGEHLFYAEGTKA